MNIIEITETELMSLNFVREVRQKLNRKQRELADAIDLTPQAVSNIEHNKNGTSWVNGNIMIQRLGGRVIIEFPELNRAYVIKDETDEA